MSAINMGFQKHVLSIRTLDIGMIFVFEMLRAPFREGGIFLYSKVWPNCYQNYNMLYITHLWRHFFGVVCKKMKKNHYTLQYMKWSVCNLWATVGVRKSIPSVTCWQRFV